MLAFLQSENIKELATALSGAQGELTEAGKTSFNPGFKSKYADLAEVIQTIRPVAAKFGLSYVQGLSYQDGLVGVTTRLMHTSGQYLESHLDLPIAKKDPQGVGGGATYGRRYALAAMLGIAQDDDDGNDASTKPKTVKPKETGSTPQTQGPSDKAVLLVSRFGLIGPGSNDEMKTLTSEYSTLTPAEQTYVLPAAKAARTRLEAVKPVNTN